MNVALRNEQFLFKGGLLAALCFVSVLPIFMLLFGSLSADGHVPTTANYRSLIESSNFAVALSNTLISSAIGAAISMLVGSWLAFLTARTDISFKKSIALVAVVPFFVSAFVHALAWSALADPKVGIINLVLAAVGVLLVVDISTIGGVALVQGLYHIPFVFLFVSAALSAVDPSLEEAARTSGAGVWRTVRRVTLPIVTPALLSAGVLVFALMAGNFAIPSLLGMPANLEFVTSYIYRQMQLSPPEQGQAAAAGTVLMIITLVLYMLQRAYIGRRSYASVTGKGFRPRLIELGRWKYPCLASVALYVAIVAGIPLLALILRSSRPYFFISSLSDLWNPELMSLRNFRLVMEYDQVQRAVVNTGILAVACAVVGTAFYFLVAYGAERLDSGGSGTIRLLAALPSAVPGMVLGLSYLWIALYLPFYGTIWILLLGFLARFMPQGTGSISASLRGLHPELEESARVSGAGLARRLWRIMVPLSRRGLGAAVVLSFVLAVTELHTSILLYTAKTVVLSVVMYEFWQAGQWGAAAALSLLQSALVIAILLGARALFGTSAWSTSANP
jgi:iron(III) transport system permease protein